MRIFNRAHVPWFVFVCLASFVAALFYIANFHPDRLPFRFPWPAFLGQAPPSHQTIGGTPLGLIFGGISFAIFVFAALLGVRKKIPLWRIGTVQRWLRAHIWLTLLTIPLVFLHSGFHFGGPMTTWLIVLYTIVMVSGIYGLALQHQVPRLMKERLPAETVFEQIPHIRAQLCLAAEKLRDSFLPTPPKKTDAGAPAPSAAKSVTVGAPAMAAKKGALSTPTARAKTAVGSMMTAEPVSRAAATSGETTAANAAAIPSESPKVVAVPQANLPETIGTPTAPGAGGADPGEVQAASATNLPPPGSTPPAPAAAPPAAKVLAPTRPKPAAAPAKPVKPPPPAGDPASEAILAGFIETDILPYLSARRGKKFRLGNARYSDDTFRFVKLRVAEGYRTRVEEIQAWCDERRTLDLQTRLHHWLHGWLFIHVPISFLLLLMTAWHAFVTLFYY